MSVSPSGMGGFNIISSIAGTQSNSANTDRVKADQSAQKFQVEQKQYSQGELEVEGETTSADRDADGRLLSRPARPKADDEETEDTVRDESIALDPPRGKDAFEERGTSLDLDA